MSGNLGYNSENTADALSYNGGGQDWLGRDDGTKSST